MVETSERPPSGSRPTSEVAYRSLYRRFRPQRFDEVRGQEHVAIALRNAVRDGRVTHAYLFSGPRGTGKTSTARILARALNCSALEGGEPCGRCESCRSIAAGTSFDVHELDAASTNGVDAMRDLVARAALATPGRWKVYIVDEVHMLSTAASNALLKTLEEPPDHVVFVLATTDPQKVLPTVRSRTQHYEFHLLGEDVLAPLLAEVAQKARLDLPEGALAVALRQGRGSARDCLSALDQLAAGGVVVEDDHALSQVLEALAARDLARVLAGVEDATRAGRDPQQLAVDLIGRLRRSFFLLVAPSLQPPGAQAVEPDEQEVASSLGTARLVRAIEVLGGAIVAMRDAPDPRITLEVALARLAHPEADDSPAALLERLERLERQLASSLPAPSMQTEPPRASTPAPRPAPAAPRQTGEASSTRRAALGAYRARQPEPGPMPGDLGTSGEQDPRVGPVGGASPPQVAPTRDELVAAWGDHILVSLRPKVRAIFQAGRFVGGGAGGARFALPNEAHLVHAEPLRQEVAEALARHFGGTVALELVVDEGSGGIDQGARELGRAGARALASASLALEEDPAEHVVDEEAAPVEPLEGISLAEDRLRRAFPGAEEV